MNNNEWVDLRWILAVIQRWKWYILGFILAACALAVIVTAVLPPVYTASVTMLVDPARDSNSSQYTTLVAGQQLAITYGQMLKDNSIFEQVIKDLELDETPGDLADKVEVSVVQDTQLITLSASDSSPANATAIANDLAETFVAKIQDLNRTRYANSLNDMETRLDNLATQISSNQTRVDELNATSVQQNSQLTRQQSLLSEYQSNVQALQQAYQDTQLALTQKGGKVSILEPASATNLTGAVTNTAHVILWVDQILDTTRANYSTYQQMLVRPTLLADAVNKLGLEVDSNNLVYSVTADTIPGTQMIELTVSDFDADQAISLANAIAEEFVGQVSEMLASPFADHLNSLQSQIDDLNSKIGNVQSQIETLSVDIASTQTELENLNTTLTENRSDYRTLQQSYEDLQVSEVSSSNSLVITEPATKPTQKTLNKIMLNAIIALLLSAVLGVGGVLFYESMNDTIRTAKDVTETMGLNILGNINRIPKLEPDIISETGPTSFYTEAFKMIVTNIRRLEGNDSIHTLVITSPKPGEGKSRTASNLATAFARRGLKVILVDADLRLPNIHHMFGIALENGLTDVLEGQGLQENLKETSVKGLLVLTGGHPTTAPTEMVSSANMKALLEEARKQADIVILDTSPILSVADTSILASEVDGAMLVLRAGSTSRQSAFEAAEQLRKAKANLIGVALNDVPERVSAYSRYFSPQT